MAAVTRRKPTRWIITSWVTLGTLFGALAADGTADGIGRRYEESRDAAS